jgi:hypothetical protein
MIVVGEALLWLFIINLGMVLGAGLYESRIVVPIWAAAPPQSLKQPETGLRFWVWITTGPLTLLIVANLAAALLSAGPRRGWWLAAALIVAAERAATFSYFVPTMLRLQRGEWSPAAAATLARWSAINYLRHATILAGLLAALRALSLPAA